MLLLLFVAQFTFLEVLILKSVSLTLCIYLSCTTTLWHIFHLFLLSVHGILACDWSRGMAIKVKFLALPAWTGVEFDWRLGSSRQDPPFLDKKKNIKGFVPFTLFIIISEFNVENMIFDVSFWLKGSTKHGQCSPVLWDCMALAYIHFIMQLLTYQYCQLYNYILMLWAVLPSRRPSLTRMTRDVSPVSPYRHGSDHHFQPPPPAEGCSFFPSSSTPWVSYEISELRNFIDDQLHRQSCVQGSWRQQHCSAIRGLLKSKGELFSSSVVW